jgi:hypothetical protein
MADWVKCTRPDGKTAFLNMDRAISMSREAESGPTRIAFVGGQELTVTEAPERLIDDDFEDASDDD